MNWTGEYIALFVFFGVLILALFVERLLPHKQMKGGDRMEKTEKIRCPHCKTEGKHILRKSWTMKGAKDIPVLIKQFQCVECREPFRKGVRILEKTKSN